MIVATTHPAFFYWKSKLHLKTCQTFKFMLLFLVVAIKFFLEKLGANFLVPNFSKKRAQMCLTWSSGNPEPNSRCYSVVRTFDER